MATSNYFNGKLITLPGVYSTIKSAIQNPPSTGDYSKVLIIDTGGGATYGGGAGINGELASGQDAVYEFTDLISYRDYLKGGILWKAAEALFKPKGAEIGVSTVYHVKAATTTAADLSWTPTGGGAAGGTFLVHPKDEGLIGNGTLTSDVLTKGYGFAVDSGVIDTAKWIYKIYKGNYTGAHSDSISYDEIDLADSTPTLLVQSPEFNNVQELLDWANTDPNFGAYFELDATSAVTGTGVVDAADVSALVDYNVATSGTENYQASDLTDALEAVKDLDYTFILADVYGTSNYNSAAIGAIMAHIETDAKYDKYLFYGGGASKAEFSATDGSLDMSAYHDTNRFVTVHSSIKKASNKVSSGFRTWPSLMHAAYWVGRIAGLPPQVPGTFKNIGIDGLTHNPSDKEKKQALDGGVGITYFDTDFNDFIILQDVNSLQNNTNIVNPDGKSFYIQIERIKAQLNKDLVVNAKIQLLGQPQGVNRNTLSANFVKDWVEGFLETKKATSSSDNLIISFQNVTVTRAGDAYQVSYEFYPNTPISKLFIVGLMLD